MVKAFTNTAMTARSFKSGLSEVNICLRREGAKLLSLRALTDIFPTEISCCHLCDCGTQAGKQPFCLCSSSCCLLSNFCAFYGNLCFQLKDIVGKGGQNDSSSFKRLLQLGREGSFAYGCADAGSAGHRKSSRAGSCSSLLHGRDSCLTWSEPLHCLRDRLIARRSLLKGVNNL